MGKEVRADVGELASLGRSMITAGKGLRSGLKSAREDCTLPTAVFGNLPNSEYLNEDYERCFELAGTAIEDLAEVAEGDSDRLIQIAFAYQAQDRSAGEQIEDAGPRFAKGDTEPSDKPGPAPTPPE